MLIVRDGWSTAWAMVGQPDHSPSSRRGQKTYGDRNGKRGTRTSLIAGKRGKELLAPILFKGSTKALWFNQWLEEHLIPELKPNSTLILDNAAFHRQDDVFRIAEQTGHKVLFLPPYSPTAQKPRRFTLLVSHLILIVSNKILRREALRKRCGGYMGRKPLSR